MLDMNNVKNTYLIAINVTNKQKEMYYHEYVPDLMDSLQDLTELRTAKLNGLWALAATLEGDLMQASHGLMAQLGSEIDRNQPQLDSLMYISHNSGTFNEPADRQFEPSPVWHDEDAMAVDETAKVYLRNMLTKSKGQLGELRRDVDRKRREVDSARQNKRPPAASLTTSSKDKEKGKDKDKDRDRDRDEVDLIRNVFALQEELHALEHRRITAEMETSTITAAVGDVTLGAKNHNFKAQTFHMPTNCDLCGERIWGISAKGFDCRDCGYTCHSKCEMKVPAECPGEQTKDQRKKLKAERQEAANALLSVAAPGAADERPSRSSTSASVTSRRTSRLGGLGRASSSHSRAGAGGAEDRPSTPAVDEEEEEEEEEQGRRAGADDDEAARVATPPPPPRPAASAPPAPATPPPAKPSALAGVVGAASAAAAAKKPRIMAPPPSAYIMGGGGGAKPAEQKGKMLYSFDANGEGEVSVPEGRDVVLLEPDGGFSTRGGGDAMADHCLQTAPAGSRFAQGIRRASCRRRMSTFRLHPRRPRPRPCPSPPQFPRHQRPRQPPPLAAAVLRARRRSTPPLEAPRAGRARRSRPSAAQRSSATSRRCTSTRRRARRSTRWRWASGLCSSARTPATGGSRSRRAGARGACRQRMSGRRSRVGRRSGGCVGRG
jgi:hypothetical protein